MKYMVTRTSNSDAKPCDEAKQMPYTRIDVRTTDDPAKIPATLGKSEWWYRDGKNHRVENGRIMRDFEDTAWFVEIKSLKQLNDFIKKYGSIVISHAYDNPSIMEIEIYDDYRE